MPANTMVTAKERPMLFSRPMVRALLDGRKTQTRLIVKFKKLVGGLMDLPHIEYARDGMPIWWQSPPDDRIRQSDYYDRGMPCPYGNVGDRLFVRETWQPCINGDTGETTAIYRADWDSNGRPEGPADGKWRPSIFMPKWASRITLQISEVRVQRVQEISEVDAQAEGAAHWWKSLSRKDQERVYSGGRGPCGAFKDLWCEINGEDSWKANPYVWALTFHRVTS